LLRFLGTKCAKNEFATGDLPLTPLGAYPDSLAGFKEPTSKGRGKTRRGGEGKRKWTGQEGGGEETGEGRGKG